MHNFLISKKESPEDGDTPTKFGNVKKGLWREVQETVTVATPSVQRIQARNHSVDAAEARDTYKDYFMSCAGSCHGSGQSARCSFLSMTSNRFFVRVLILLLSRAIQVFLKMNWDLLVHPC